MTKRQKRTETTETNVDTGRKKAEAGLFYASDEEPGFTRRPYRNGWRYFDTKGERVTDRSVIERINAMAIPPAYTDVWICPEENGHIQATGRDARGRKQYLYHPRFREMRDSSKYEHMLEFARSLPGIRQRIDSDMRRRGLPREKILATIIWLLEATMIRVGNIDYARQNRSYGLTTLNDRHVRVERDEIRFRFTGKGGKLWNLKLTDRRVARIVRQSQELPGQHLFQYLDEDGERREVTSGDVNAYLREISGSDITAKDFRTWAGTVLTALTLVEFERTDSEAAAKRNVQAAIRQVATQLGNTPAICRRCYVHPQVIDSYLTQSLVLEIERKAKRAVRSQLEGLRPEEMLVLSFLQSKHCAAQPTARR
ncbi:DNA topoisomerase IB [Sphingobium chlorophenolicum]|uniref:DNA topoisomerase n=1 Tax=Sphingobium chlorophenolicum TaxID=46429 RepID=A0A081RDZ4_SPHCR|nr:DNA topoisomerase IB [Sphingobium chlorophenolicum]KEQ53417.1 DNA topoisomerase [Sphingobium chlorophenolicum]